MFSQLVRSPESEGGSSHTRDREGCYLIWGGTIGLDEFEEFSPQNANPLPERMIYLIACTALLAALGPEFSSLLTRLAYRERLLLLAWAPTELFAFTSLPMSTPKGVCSGRLEPCALSLYATVIAK